ncbi:unnamed protein product [Caenorhabditis nigoni]
MLKNMKSLFIIWIFWTFSIDSSGVSLDPDQKIFIEKLNELRRTYQNWSSKMHELEWSPNLQDILTNLELDRIPQESERKWRFTMISGYENGIEELEKSTNSNIVTGPSDRVWYYPRYEHILPFQTLVACAKKEKLLGNFKILCLFGPEHVLGKFRQGDPAAYKCFDGYQDGNGLCRRAGKKTQTGTDVTTKNPTTQKQETEGPGPKQAQFIQKLNEKRRVYAMKWNVSNMHELSWNVTSKTWTKFNIESDDYGKELVKLEAKIQENKTIEDFELLDPMKFEIRCGYYNKTTPLFCIFGPGKTTTNYTKGSPGSNCQNGFENNHGLCSRTITITTPSGPTRRIPENSIETRTLPKELEDYVEVDGDDYDEDFPTGEPLLDSGFENFLQFWITVVFVFGSCFFGFHLN